MSRAMLTSWGIQWLAQADRYLSQAHLYFRGTSWLTSVCPLMMRLSSARTRPGTGWEAWPGACGAGMRAARGWFARAGPTSNSGRTRGSGPRAGPLPAPAEAWLKPARLASGTVELLDSSQDSIGG